MNYKVFLSILPALLPLFVSCNHKTEQKADEEAVVRIDTVRAPEGAVELQYPGHVVAATEANVSFKVAGTLKRVLVSEGDYVKAGQLIDRVGGMLGLPFPAGPALEALAGQAQHTYSPRATVRGCDCHLSGVENQCRDRLQRGDAPAEVARFCLDSVRAAIEGMTEALFADYGELPLVYAGGVMANRLLREYFTAHYGGHFAPPAYSADNAAGIACLGRIAEKRGIVCRPFPYTSSTAM